MAVFLPPLAAKLSSIAADDSNQRLTAGLRVIDPNDGTYRVDVTDGSALVVLRGHNLPQGNIELPEREESVRAGTGIIGPAEWEAGFKMLPKPKKGVGPMPLALVLRKNDVCMASVGAQRQVPLLEGKYPDFGQVLPKGPAKFSIPLQPSYVIDLMTIAKAVLGDDIRVVFHVWKPDGPVGFSCSSPQHGGVFMDAMLMPLT